MTALSEFQRLEAQGSWRETPRARLREVVVSVGDATLILTDPKSDTPLSHWSLPAIARLNPGQIPAIYSPDPEGEGETVEIDDRLMIEAIERVHRAIASHRAHPGRLRGGLTIVAAMTMLGAAVMWLPGAIIGHASRIAPPAQARQIGLATLADLERSTGAVCARKSGQAVLDWLAPQLVEDDALLRVVPGPLNGALRLPGDVYVLGDDLLDGAAGPEAAAGHLVAASLAADPDEITHEALDHAGLRAALQLMTLGDLPQRAMTGYGEQLLSRAVPRPDTPDLLAALESAGVPAEPYANSIDPTGASVLPLIEGDAFRDQLPERPLLTDEQWLALQQICAG